MRAFASALPLIYLFNKQFYVFIKLSNRKHLFIFRLSQEYIHPDLNHKKSYLRINNINSARIKNYRHLI